MCLDRIDANIIAVVKSGKTTNGRDDELIINVTRSKCHLVLCYAGPVRTSLGDTDGGGWEATEWRVIFAATRTLGIGFRN